MQGAFSEMDDDIGWNDFALRSYDPQIGRWMQMDPFADNYMTSPYVGMGNDPIGTIDPSGGETLPYINIYSTVGRLTGEVLPTVIVTAGIAAPAAKAVSTLQIALTTTSILSKVGNAVEILSKAVNTNAVGPTGRTSVDPPKLKIPLEGLRDFIMSTIQNRSGINTVDQWIEAYHILDAVQIKLETQQFTSFMQRFNSLNGTSTGSTAEAANGNPASGNFTLRDAESALRVIYDRFGKDMASTVERMYRLETRHFTSGQYRHTGTGGMEVHGAAPYYGYTASYFEGLPTGVYSAYENKGLSGVGGNAQVTDRPKQFVVMPSVEAAMIFKVNYIIGHGGNYARWLSTDPKKQAVYRQQLQSIIPTIVNRF